MRVGWITNKIWLIDWLIHIIVSGKFILCVVTPASCGRTQVLLLLHLFLSHFLFIYESVIFRPIYNNRKLYKLKTENITLIKYIYLNLCWINKSCNKKKMCYFCYCAVIGCLSATSPLRALLLVDRPPGAAPELKVTLARLSTSIHPLFGRILPGLLLLQHRAVTSCFSREPCPCSTMSRRLLPWPCSNCRRTSGRTATRRRSTWESGVRDTSCRRLMLMLSSLAPGGELASCPLLLPLPPAPGLARPPELWPCVPDKRGYCGLTFKLTSSEANEPSVASLRVDSHSTLNPRLWCWRKPCGSEARDALICELVLILNLIQLFFTI